MTTTVTIILALIVIIVPLIVWQVRSSREQIEREAKPDTMDRVEIYDLHRSGGDFL